MKISTRRTTIIGAAVLCAVAATTALGTPAAADALAEPTARAASRAGTPAGPYGLESSSGWRLQPAASDEFSTGRLDQRRWHNGMTYWDGRSPSFFASANVSVRHGVATLGYRDINQVANPTFEQDTTRWTVSGTAARVADPGSETNTVIQLSPDATVSQTVRDLRPHTTYRITARTRVDPGARAELRVTGAGPGTQVAAIDQDAYGYTSITVRTGQHVRALRLSFRNVGGSGNAYGTQFAVVTPRWHGTAVPVGSYLAASAIQSTQKLGYGYYETRMSVAADLHSSSFWMQGDTAEIDVVEGVGRSTGYPGFETTMATNTHWFANGWENDIATPGFYDTGASLADTWHVYGVDWRADSITWYLDGKEVFRVTGAGAQRITDPMYVIFDTEAFYWHGLSDTTVRSQFRIDWVRAWVRR